jgi:16S rRNA (cytidine1402-2'-O)-methyltransferase
LSKRFEETRRGTLTELAAHFEAGARGEIVMVVAGRPEGEPDPEQPVTDPAEQARAWAAAGQSVRDIRDALMRQGLRKNDAYALALQVTQVQAT